MRKFTLNCVKSLLMLFALAAVLNVSQAQMPDAITVEPAGATVFDDIILTFNPEMACYQAGSLVGVPLVYMHSGVTIGGNNWQNVVEYNAVGANGQSPHLTPNGDGTYSIAYNPAAFYGIEAGTIVTHICAVFNDGQWDSKDGRDGPVGPSPNPGSECFDFFIPLAYTSTDPKFSFKVNMNKAALEGIFDPLADDVYAIVAQRFEPILLDPSVSLIYTGTLEEGLDSGVVYNVHFRINEDVNEDVIRPYTAVPGVVSIDVWWNDDPINEVLFQCDMTYQVGLGTFKPDLDFLDLAGSMNGWGGSGAMTRIDTSFVYEIGYTLDAGTIYEYKYRINGDWNTSEFPGGGPNRMFLAPDHPMTVYNIYNDFNPATIPMLFQCNMSYQISAGHFDPAVDYLDIAGNFNGWGAYDVCFDRGSDEIYVITKMIDTINIGGSPLEFKFRFNGDWGTSEFPGGGPNRKYDLLDTTGGVQNIYYCWYDNKDPNIPTPPWAYDLRIDGTLIVGNELTGVYTYENVNGIPEGESTFKWYWADDNSGTNLTEITDATAKTYTTQTAEIGKFVAFEVTPIAESGDSAVGLPVMVYSGDVIGGLAIQEVGNTWVKFYPNPVSDQITFEHLDQITRIAVYNSMGQEVMSVSNIATLKLTLPINMLRAGVYFVKFFGNDRGVGTAKFLKY
ncbi:MAG: T9SS type A sorting domain-containing protein [Bacteroidota bacterium]